MPYDDKDSDDTKKTSKDADIHAEALEDFKRCQEADAHNREAALADLKFGRLGKQWDEAAEKKREQEGRPCMTFNRMPTFIRQVVNDGRQNKPAIKTHPADDKGDPATSQIFDDLIRNIEYCSDADTAYDTGLDFAASSGAGYWEVGIEYARDDSFDLDIEIQAIPNALAIYPDWEHIGECTSTWNRAFKVHILGRDAFDAQFKGEEKVDWDSGPYADMSEDWRDGEDVVVAAYWRRREVKRRICLLTDGRVVSREWLDSEVVDAPPEMPGLTNEQLLAEGAGVTVRDERETTSYEVTQYIMSGCEILKTTKWPGRFIPIAGSYGEVVNVEGKRYTRSLIRDAKGAQQNFNYWRTTSTELVALAPKAPFIGAAGQFDTDADKWARANTDTLSYIEYDPVEGAGPPQRQPFAGVPAGALQEALNASDDMKAIMGLYDASLGARSNETSGRAINARKAEGDTSTFHILDNQSRAIRQTGRIIIDLIPHVYNKDRIIRVMGIDKTPQNVRIGQKPEQEVPGMAQVYDLTVGKYDLTVDTGPGFQTKREEAAYGMTELMRAVPQTAIVLAPHLAKAQDWPGADEISEELKALAPKPPGPGQDPQSQQMQQQIQQMGQQMQQMHQALEDKQAERAQEAKKLEIDLFKAQTDRIKALGLTVTPEAAAALGMQTAQDAQQALNGVNPGGPPQPGGPPPQQQQPQQQPPNGGFFSPEQGQQ